MNPTILTHERPTTIRGDLSLRAYELILWLAILEAQRLNLVEPLTVLTTLHTEAGVLRRAHDEAFV